MPYRVNVQFKDGSTDRPPAEVVAATPPRCGDTIIVGRRGRPVSVRVYAIWTPSSKLPGPGIDGLVMVEAREI
jgi:hypothetical protein